MSIAQEAPILNNCCSSSTVVDSTTVYATAVMLALQVTTDSFTLHWIYVTVQNLTCDCTETYLLLSRHTAVQITIAHTYELLHS
jgi:hypothetical protein